jgi:ACS family D-galactonate transporter-like MFS transporter
MMSTDAMVDGAARPTNRRRIIAAMLFVSVVINYLDRSNISIAGPHLAGALHLDPVQMGLVFSGFGWSYAALQVPTGWVVDRVEPRLLYAAALALWSVATMSLGLAGSFAVLFALRVAVGVCEAPAFPVNNRIATTWFGERQRAGVIGFYTSGQFVGLAFLAPVLTWLDAHYGWEAVFVITGLVGLVWAVIWYAAYRDPVDFPGANAAEVALIAEGGGIPDLGRRLAERRAPFRWADLALVLSSRKLWGIYIGQFGLNCTAWFFLTWFPTYLVHYRHMDFIRAGFYAAIPFLAAFLGSLSGGFVSDLLLRRGASLGMARKLPIIAGLLLSTVIVGANYVQSPALVVAFLTVAFFANGFASITWSLVSALAPERLIGLTGGVFNLCGNLAAIAVPIVIGLLVSGDDFTLPMLFVAGTALLGALSYIVLVGKVERLAG